MGQAEKLEVGPIRLRMACALRHLWAEIDEACLVGMEREPTSRKTLAQDRQHAFGVDDIVERYDASLANWARVLSPLRRGLSRRRAPLFRSGLPLGGDCRLCSRRLLVFRLGGPRLRLVRLLRRRFGHLGFDGSRQLFSGRVGLVLRWAGWRVDGRFGRRLASLVPALRDLRLEPRLGGQPEPLRAALRPSFLLPKVVRDLANKSLVIGHCHLLVSSQPQRSSAAPSPTSRSPRKTLMLRLASASTLRPFFIALGGSNPKK